MMILIFAFFFIFFPGFDDVGDEDGEFFLISWRR